MNIDELTGTALSEAVAKALGWDRMWASIHSPVPDFAHSLDAWLTYCWLDLQARGWALWVISDGPKGSEAVLNSYQLTLVRQRASTPSEAACRAFLKARGGMNS